MACVLLKCQASRGLALRVETVLVSDALLQELGEVGLLPGCFVDVLRIRHLLYVMEVSRIFIVSPDQFVQVDSLAAMCVFYPMISVDSFADVLEQ